MKPLLRSLGRVALVILGVFRAPAAESLAPLGAQPPAALKEAGIPRRLLAIDNVCAWPNLVALKDGSLVAIVYNQPNHGVTMGDIECWGSADGRFWKYLSTITKHSPGTSRLNHGAGLNANGDLVVLCNGWDKYEPTRNRVTSRPLQSVGAISRDGGKSWEELGPVLPAEPGLSWHVPFGDIQNAANGDLVLGTYAFSHPHWRVPAGESHLGADGRTVVTNKVPPPPPLGGIYAARSRDGGRTWAKIAPIVVDRHVEAAMLHLGGGRWLAAGRRFEHIDLDIFASNDDAVTWQRVINLDVKPVSSPHLLKLSDGRVLLTYGNRIPGNRGIDVRTSSDGGKTWAAPQRLIALETGDCGYPDVVELPGKRLLVVYYADGIPEHQRYHMGVINLTLDEIR